MHVLEKGRPALPAGEHWLILVKHSLPEITPGVRPSRWPLSEIGCQRCLPLSEKLFAFQPQQIFSSIEPKALQTAQLISHNLSIPFQHYEGLHEHPREATLNFSERIFQSNIAAFFAQPDKLIYGEETANQCRNRFMNAVTTLLNQNKDQNLVVVAHGTVITLFIAHTCGIDPFPFWKRLGLPSCVVLTYPTLSMHSIVEQVA